MTVCQICLVEFYKQPSVINSRKHKKLFCSQKCKTEFLRSQKSEYGFKKSLISHGVNARKRIVKDGKRIYEHRFIMEEFLERKLSKNEHVHHINGDPKDNRIENLQVLSASDHGKAHHPKKQ